MVGAPGGPDSLPSQPRTRIGSETPTTRSITGTSRSATPRWVAIHALPSPPRARSARPGIATGGPHVGQRVVLLGQVEFPPLSALRLGLSAATTGTAASAKTLRGICSEPRE